MYTMNKSIVKINGSLSSEFSVARGVRQGDILSPLLFNIFINDIIKEFHVNLCEAPSILQQKVGCLLYADDLVIMSTSKDGLQHGLDRLTNYCRRWKLEVNLSKSKLMCLSKARQMTDFDATINGSKLEQVPSYLYLGFDISWNGSLKKAEKHLSDKAQKAIFKLRSLIFGSNMKPSTSLQLFDQLIKPICLYGSEIWITDTLKLDDEQSLAKSMDSVMSEKLNLSYSKFTLGLHRKAQNTAVRGELGRLPLGLDAITNGILYYLHLKHKSTNPLLKEVCALNTLNIKNSWVTKTEKLLYIIQNNNLTLTEKNMNRKNIRSYLTSLYEKYWVTKMNLENKMRTYKLIKSHLTYEQYLDIMPTDKRRSLTRFRASAHNLAIERGRYNRPPTPLEQRTCQSCPQCIQDEYHFLIECREFTDARNHLFNKIIQLCPLFHHLSPLDQFIFMLTAEGNIIKDVAQFIDRYLP